MGRGGHRDGAGRKSGWNHTETQTIRVPKIFAAQLMDMARRLDSGEPENPIAPTSSEVKLEQPIDEPQFPQVHPDQMDIFSLIPEVIESVTESNIPLESDVIELVTESKNVPDRPDGVRWLSSKIAWEIAKSRGCDRNLEGFRKWSQRNPNKSIQLYGLRKLPTPPKGNTAAPAFEDLRYQEEVDCQHF